MTYHSEVSVHQFFALYPIYKNTLFIPQRLNTSVANRMGKLNDAWEQQQIKFLSLYQEKWILISKTQIWVQDPSEFDIVSRTARFLSSPRSSISKSKHLSTSLVWAVRWKKVQYMFKIQVIFVNAYLLPVQFAWLSVCLTVALSGFTTK